MPACDDVVDVEKFEPVRLDEVQVGRVDRRIRDRHGFMKGVDVGAAPELNAGRCCLLLGGGPAVVAAFASRELVGPPSGMSGSIDVGDRFALEPIGDIQLAIRDRPCEMFLGLT